MAQEEKLKQILERIAFLESKVEKLERSGGQIGTILERLIFFLIIGELYHFLLLLLLLLLLPNSNLFKN